MSEQLSNNEKELQSVSEDLEVLRRNREQQAQYSEDQLRQRLAGRIQSLGNEGFDLAQTILSWDTASWAMGANYPLMTPVEDVERFIGASQRDLEHWAQKRPQSAE